MKRWWTRLDSAIVAIEKFVIATALTVMAVAVFLQVLLRYLFSTGIPWAEELARYLMIWAGFFGASLATRSRRHLKVDLLARIVYSDRLKAIVQRFALAISALFCLFLCRLGILLVHHSYTTGRLSPTMEIPIWTIQLSIPISLGLMALRFAVQTLGRFTEEPTIEASHRSRGS